MSEIFLYTPNAKPTDYALKQLRAAGYIPVKVASLDDVRLMPKPAPIAEADANLVAHAAFNAIRQHGGSGGVQHTFGAKLAALMEHATKPGEPA